MTDSLPPHLPSSPSNGPTDIPPQSLLEKLQAQVRMRPRWYFWLRNIGLAVGSAGLAVAAVFAVGGLLFLWRTRELGVLPGFGIRGLPFFFGNFPWGVATASFLILVGLLVFIRHFTPGYRWPLLFLVAFGVVAASLFGLAASRSPIHGFLANRALRGDLPPFIGRAYRPYVDDDHIVTGQITAVDGRVYTLLTPTGSVAVDLTDEAQQRLRFPLDVGAFVMVIGQRNDGRIEAEAIRPFHRMMRRPPFPAD